MNDGEYGTILVVEDDEYVSGFVRLLLEEARFHVVIARDGQVGLQTFWELQPDVLVTDVNLPSLDGLSLCREVRKKSEVPILILSARQDEVDKVSGLEVGADDYLSKPFGHREFVARVRALFRRVPRSPLNVPPSAPTVPPAQKMQFGPLVINVDAREVTLIQQPIHLTPTEFSLLHVLASRPGRVLSRQQLADLSLGHDWVGEERTIDVHLRRLRTKLLKIHPHDFLPAVRGVGYKFSAPELHT